LVVTPSRSLKSKLALLELILEMHVLEHIRAQLRAISGRAERQRKLSNSAGVGIRGSQSCVRHVS
jgi:hypothetical protein